MELILLSVLLAIIQGLTEFLPISSSAHLLLPSLIFGFQDLGLSFDIATHVGTLTAVIYFFARTFHYIMHIVAIPLTRTICFLIGVACQIVMATTIFNAL